MGSPQRSSGHLLDQVCAKLMWAQHHLQVYEATVSEWADSGPYRSRKEYDPESGWYTFTCVEMRPLPANLSLVFGDYLFNLRATLDYLAQALVRANRRNPDRKVAFPILIDSEQWEAPHTKKALRGIDATWVAEIKRLQPYHRGDKAAQQPLAVLNWFAQRDKHRLLHLFAVGAAEIKFRGSTYSDFPSGSLESEFWPNGNRLEDGAIIARIRTIPPTEFQVDMDPNVSTGVSPVDPGPIPEGEDYPDLTAEVQRVMRVFLPAFD